MKNRFNFDEKAVQHHMIREMKVLKQNSEAFRYIADKLPNQTELDLSKAIWTEGKNYDWCVIVNGNVTLIIRKYGSHFTIFTKVVIENNYKDETKYYNTRYGALMFHSEDGGDDLVNDNFTDFNKSVVTELIEIVRKEELHCIWNDLSFKRHKRVKVNIIFHGDSIDSVDKFMFALDELSQKYLELFAENDMLQKISTLKKGDKFGVHTVESVSFEIENPDDIYYHGLGIKYIDNWNKEKWDDVYALTRWHFEEIFPEGLKIDDDSFPRLEK